MRRVSGTKENRMNWPINPESVQEKLSQYIPTDGLVLFVQ